ncbi:unnamed protein product [Rangifer tarandus platyrhynchus]|uniref:Uncharacterized protein n=1 Tax=Rangifer tarandus platyrhynchus TaxID=3082113 RepID=A0AC59YNT5_RANTA
MDLTFQVPMQYCSLQHRALLSPVDTSTTESHFYFGPASSFFLELFLHSSLVAYWTPTDPGAHLLLSYLFAFSYCLWDSRGKNIEVVCQLPSPVDHILSEFSTMICPSWVALHSMAHVVL